MLIIDSKGAWNPGIWSFTTNYKPQFSKFIYILILFFIKDD